MKKVSVIIPVYNAEEFIEQCIGSVLWQSYENFEVIIVNDGSTDKSEEKILPYLDRDKRIKYFSQPNKGVGAARNLGLKHAKGEYIAFLDNDDVWFPWTLREMVRLLSMDEFIAALSGWVWAYDENLVPLLPKSIPTPGVVNFMLVPFNKLFVSASICRFEILRVYNIKFWEPSWSPDYDFWLKISKIGKIVVEPIYLAKYRIHTRQASKLGTMHSKIEAIKDVWGIDGDLIVDVFINNNYTLESLTEAGNIIAKNILAYFNKQNFLSFREKFEGNVFWAKEIFYRLRRFVSATKSLFYLSKIGLLRYFLFYKLLQSR